jgi:hypothetical protein
VAAAPSTAEVAGGAGTDRAGKSGAGKFCTESEALRHHRALTSSRMIIVERMTDVAARRYV